MDINRRDFLKASGLALAALALPGNAEGQQAPPPAAPATQQSQQQRQQPLMRFDIRQLRREMGLPATNGPFVTVPVRAKKNILSDEYSLYEITIDASLLDVKTLTEAEIQEQERLRGIAIPRNMGPVRLTRETVAFIAQFNLEIYMTPQQMREHIDMYKNDNDQTLTRIRDSFRDDITQKSVNTAAIVGLTDHLITYHGMEQLSVTLQNGTKVPLLKAVVDGREACKRELVKQPQRGANATPTTQPEQPAASNG